jgi:hypothetical protein
MIMLKEQAKADWQRNPISLCAAAARNWTAACTHKSGLWETLAQYAFTLKADIDQHG